MLNSIWNPRPRDALLVALLAGFLFLYGAGSRTLRDSSEGRVARVAQEMLDRGDGVVPHLNGQVRLAKPPLSSWLVAGAGWLFHGGQVQTRDALLPTGLAAAALVVLVYWWLSRRKDEGSRAAGALGALALATMGLFFLQARTAEMDMLLALCVAAAFWAYERHRLEDWRPGLPIFYAALAVGILVKGHVVLVVVLPALLAWRGWAALPARPAPGAWKRHLLGLALLLLIVLPWGLQFVMKSGITWHDFYQEGVNRFDEDAAHREPWFFYLAGVPAWGLPWFALLPFVVWWEWKSPPDEDTPRRRLWWLWFGLNLLIWTLVTSKQRHYALPWLVPLALLTGDGIARMAREAAAEDEPRRCALWGWRAAVLLGVLLAAATLVAAAYAPSEDVASLLLWSFATVAAVGFVIGATTLTYAEGRGLFESWWAAALCVMLLYANSWEAAVDRDRSPAFFCSEVREVVPADTRLYDANVASRRPCVIFYLGRNVEPVAVAPETEAEAAAPRPVRDERRMERLTQAVTELLTRGPDTYVLVQSDLEARLPESVYEEPFPGETRFIGHDWGAHLLRRRNAP